MEKANEYYLRINKKTILHSIITIAVLAVLYIISRRLSGVILPFLISFVVAYILAPIVNFFQHRCRLRNRLLSVVVTILCVAALFGGVIAALTPAISKQATALSNSIKHYVSSNEGIEQLSPRINEKLEEIIQSMDIQAILRSNEFQEGVKEVLPRLYNWISNGVEAMTSVAIAFICILYIIFLLIDYEKIKTNWKRYLPNRFRDTIVMLMRDLDKSMNAYFRGQALVACIVGVLFAIGFQIIGLPMAIGMGLLIGVMNLVPYLQTLGIPPCIVLGLIQSAETGRPIWVVLLGIAAVFVIVQIIQDGIIVPKIMGNVTGMGPAWILLSLSVWGSLLGLVGMIIALPITSLLVSYSKRFVLHMPDNATNNPQPKAVWTLPFFKRNKN